MNFKLNRETLLHKNTILIGLAVVAVIVTAVLVFANTKYGSNFSVLKSPFGMSAEAAAKKAVGYLNDNVLPEGQTAELGTVSEESGIVKMQVKIGENTYDSYVTKDGKFFFPEAFNLDSAPATN